MNPNVLLLAPCRLTGAELQTYKNSPLSGIPQKPLPVIFWLENLDAIQGDTEKLGMFMIEVSHLMRSNRLGQNVLVRTEDFGFNIAEEIAQTAQKLRHRPKVWKLDQENITEQVIR